MSTPKAKIQTLLDDGFTADGFGSPTDFTTADTGYLARVLAEAGRWVEMGIGQAAYGAAVEGTYEYDQMARAEARYAARILWTRRIKFLDANAQAGLQTDQFKVIQYFQKQADQAYAEALEARGNAVRLVGGDGDVVAGSAMVSGTVETGPYPPVEAPA